jgi:hypothetical protein
VDQLLRPRLGGSAAAPGTLLEALGESEKYLAGSVFAVTVKGSDLHAGLHTIPLDLPDRVLVLLGGEVLEDVGPRLVGGSKQREVQA